MTKAELIEALSDLGDDEEVFVAVPTRDHWDNVLARPIHTAWRDTVKKSDYHRGKLKIQDIPDEDEENEQEVFILFPPEAV